MLIGNLTCTTIEEVRHFSATVVWEDHDFSAQLLTFEIHDVAEDNEPAEPGGGLDPQLSQGGPGADAFLAACFPLAAVHGEARVRIDANPCPMLVEGLRTAHGWWANWGGMSAAMPKIETSAARRIPSANGPRRAVAFLSGGVDSLHMLMRNRQLYRPDDLAYFRDVLFIHGFDIGKRARNPENERYRAALQRLAPVADEVGVRVIPCRTNLRHLPSKPDFWTYRHNGAALAAVGHAALRGPSLLSIAASHHLADPVPMGSHPAVDHLLSSQRLQIIHDGSRFTRLEKVRELATWPTGLAALRVCPETSGEEANCGHCEKCLRTRLEFLAVGVEETEALGPSLTPIELWDEAVPSPSGHRAIMYEHLLPPLRARGLNALCRTLEARIDVYRTRIGDQSGGASVDKDRRGGRVF